MTSSHLIAGTVCPSLSRIAGGDVGDDRKSRHFPF